MTDTAEKAFQAVFELPAAERSEVIERLNEVVDEPPQSNLGPEWKSEIRRRIAEYDAGGVTTYTWEEVKQYAKQCLAKEGIALAEDDETDDV